jgi:hypothetical protein
MGDKPVRNLQYGDIRQVQGIWTAHKVDMHDLGRKSHTIMTMDKLQYNVKLSESDFTLQALRRSS